MRQKQGVFSLFLLSPSSRRAWIEIFPNQEKNTESSVALLAEGVDRNKKSPMPPVDGRVALLAEGVDKKYRAQCRGRRPRRSPSSRRAWIEIAGLS